MNVIYSGKPKELNADLESKIEGKFAKLSKFIEQRGEREAHVTHCLERRLHKVKAVISFYDHVLVGEGLDSDFESSVCQAIAKLETQIVELRSRWRDTHRDAKAVRSGKEATSTNGTQTGLDGVANGNAAPRKPRIFQVDHNDGRKPMTLEEALIEMESTSDYVVYQDSERNCLSVLVRRKDGNYDLIQS
jgi:putative sigma-54 modulation protein